ncbi:MAG: phthiotriol/phenolphthiotriol dimycocerosates methyltransferase [Anaerolineales bacterium]
MPSLQQTFWKYWYKTLTGRIQNRPDDSAPITFLNYGYWPPEGETLPLDPADEPNRPAIQLYHHVASGDALAGKSVLEVSCGHGGGASFVQRYHQPAAYTAIDQNPKAIEFCRNTHAALGIHFQIGDAQALAFPADHFDVVLNVEASHCYPRQGDFFRSVYRVLKPGGQFLYADFRPRAGDRNLDRDLTHAGFRTLAKTEITPHVLRALQRTSEHYRALVRRMTPKFLHRTMESFAAVEGSGMYNSFANGERVYWSYRLRKD